MVGSVVVLSVLFILIIAEMETSKSGSSKLIVMTVLEPKDELDEVNFMTFIGLVYIARVGLLL